jgi:hypothetical protein
VDRRSPQTSGTKPRGCWISAMPARRLQKNWGSNMTLSDEAARVLQVRLHGKPTLEYCCQTPIGSPQCGGVHLSRNKFPSNLYPLGSGKMTSWRHPNSAEISSDPAPGSRHE